MMKIRLASLTAALLLATTGALAQSLPYGVTLGNLQATRDATAGVSTITGSLSNQGAKRIGRAWVVFALYDSQGREIGRVKEQSIGPIAPGEIWQIRSTTPQPFERFSAIEIKAE
ncbi:FxLYD domain-containing protein [Bordetella genomosp. 6]|uniref:FxLYD domain-containing protein n=1 Tax=Bordetella genomosp. 6 TaxID=463024 RepID=UPI000A296FA6|nr:FxLYD domain-containing protein [Bordetella genomosp. 6]ARP79333.1 hypothetical protein CAL11_22100 [Bordetella genomosp. 6]